MTARASIKVQPRASRDAVAGRVGDEWKILVKAPAIEGRANQACIAFLARALRVPRSAVRIVAGAASRHKRVEVDGVEQKMLDRFLEGAG
jgi:hypothetical protein